MLIHYVHIGPKHLILCYEFSSLTNTATFPETYSLQKAFEKLENTYQIGIKKPLSKMITKHEEHLLDLL